MKVFSARAVDEIAEALREGAVVAMPTETVFGLAVAADSEEGVRKLIALKNRGVESGKVFTLVPESVEEIGRYVIVEPMAERLIQKYVPGELTLILPKNPEYHNNYFDNFNEIGIRIPDFELFRELLPKSGALLLTSANFRGEETLESAEEVMEKLPVDGVVRAEAGGGEPSTVARVVGEELKILRQGRVKMGIEESPLA